MVDTSTQTMRPMKLTLYKGHSLSYHVLSMLLFNNFYYFQLLTNLLCKKLCLVNRKYSGIVYQTNVIANFIFHYQKPPGDFGLN